MVNAIATCHTTNKYIQKTACVVPNRASQEVIHLSYTPTVELNQSQGEGLEFRVKVIHLFLHFEGQGHEELG